MQTSLPLLMCEESIMPGVKLQVRVPSLLLNHPSYCAFTEDQRNSRVWHDIDTCPKPVCQRCMV